VEPPVAGARVTQRNRDREVLGRQSIAVLVERSDLGAPGVLGDPARLLEAGAEHLRGRLVVEDDRSVGVDQHPRKGDDRDQVAGQDQLERLLFGIRHVRTLIGGAVD
jgi:hypothetical protein